MNIKFPQVFPMKSCFCGTRMCLNQTSVPNSCHPVCKAAQYTSVPGTLFLRKSHSVPNPFLLQNPPQLMSIFLANLPGSRVNPDKRIRRMHELELRRHHFHLHIVYAAYPIADPCILFHRFAVLRDQFDAGERKSSAAFDSTNLGASKFTVCFVK